MRLSPPASSSDLETAREIARRLHRADGSDSVGADSPRPRALPRQLMPSTPGAARGARPEPQRPQPRPLESRPTPGLTPPPLPMLDRAGSAAQVEPPSPSWDGAPGPIEADAPPPLDSFASLGDMPGPDAAADDGAIEIDATDTNLSDIIGEAPSLPEPEGQTDVAFQPIGEADSPFGEPPSSPFDETPVPDSVSEELFEPPPPPSWGDVVQACIGLAHARGGMLISPTSQVVASQGSWPEPGPEAIATKLVAMMEKALKDAPTRSISAPLGRLHLTAWRVPLASGLVTAAFIADAPLRAEVRAPIDAQILAAGEV